MKILAVDNYDRETVADIVVAENVQPYYAAAIADFLQGRFGGEGASRFYRAVDDDCKPWRGMEELV